MSDINLQVECECGETLSLKQYQYHFCSQAEPPESQVEPESEPPESQAEPESEPPESQAQFISSGPSSQVASCSGAARQTPDSEETLIGKLAEAVHARPALWDHTLPLKERGKDVKERLWRDVYTELEGKIPLQQLERKWRNLRDTFLKHLKTYTPSGSEGNKKKWIHFDILFFLAEKNKPRKTNSNVEAMMNSPTTTISPGPSSYNSISASERLCTGETEVEATPPSKRRKKSFSDESDKLLLNILREPPPKPATSISPALLTIQSVLEKLPARVRMQAEIDMLNKVYSLYNEFGSE